MPPSPVRYSLCPPAHLPRAGTALGLNVTTFLRRTERVVPPGGESGQLHLDILVSEIMDQRPLPDP
ncbi:hypothetical protein [Streptomyces sp. V1I6]|uniref:hypothetical protein n=1 Tax=Streptomyces sp. V1I6 TaxID=3042273 RepID=UPI0027D8CD32|nr:hypothetical protein [Streptomyces sp. V1I6]